MRKCLDARYHLDAEQIRVIVTFLELCFGVAAAHIAEIRLFFDGIAVFAVQHEHVHAHHRHTAQHGFYGGNAQNSVALRYIEHGAEFIELRRFRCRKICRTLF